jgi:hypothetical protein
VSCVSKIYLHDKLGRSVGVVDSAESVAGGPVITHLEEVKKLLGAAGSAQYVEFILQYDRESWSRVLFERPTAGTWYLRSFMRPDEIVAARAIRGRLEPGLVPVAYDHYGNYVCIRTSNPPGCVEFWDHETEETEPLARDLRTFGHWTARGDGRRCDAGGCGPGGTILEANFESGILTFGAPGSPPAQQPIPCGGVRDLTIARLLPARRTAGAYGCLARPERHELELDRVEGLGANLGVAHVHGEQTPSEIIGSEHLQHPEARIDEPGMEHGGAGVDGQLLAPIAHSGRARDHLADLVGCGPYEGAPSRITRTRSRRHPARSGTRI